MEIASRCRLPARHASRQASGEEKTAKPPCWRSVFGGRRVRIHNRSQPHAETGLLQLAVDTQMVAAKGTGAKDGYAESIVHFSSVRMFCYCSPDYLP